MMGLVALDVGPLIDRLNTKQMLILVALLVAAHALLIAQTQAPLQATGGFLSVTLARNRVSP